MRNALLILAAAITLSACASKPPEVIIPEPRIVTQTVNVPVQINCVPNIGPEPIYPDTNDAIRNAPFPSADGVLKADPSNAQALQQVKENLVYRAKLVAAGRVLRMQRDAEKSAALDKCSIK